MMIPRGGNLQLGVLRRKFLQNRMIQIVERVNRDADYSQERSAKSKWEEIPVDDARRLLCVVPEFVGI